MRQTVNGTTFVIELSEHDSSFISTIVYDTKTEVLSVVLKNDNTYNYEKVPVETFVEFYSCKSFGSYYNSNIKNKFKHLIMANDGKTQPKTVNKAGDYKRFIKLSIDVTKLKKDWFYVSKETGSVYAKLTLVMHPDGTVDQFGQLGMIVQDVPIEIVKQDKTIKGPILGNGKEFDWSNQKQDSETAVQATAEDEDLMEGLPF